MTVKELLKTISFPNGFTITFNEKRDAIKAFKKLSPKLNKLISDYEENKNIIYNEDGSCNEEYSKELVCYLEDDTHYSDFYELFNAYKIDEDKLFAVLEVYKISLSDDHNDVDLWVKYKNK